MVPELPRDVAEVINVLVQSDFGQDSGIILLAASIVRYSLAVTRESECLRVDAERDLPSW